MSNLPPLPLKDGALFIDASGWLENMTTCMRKLEYSQLHQRIKADDATALNFGTALHAAMELRYQRYGTGKVDEHYFTDLSVLMAAHFEEHPCPMDDWRNQNWLLELVKKYLERYPTEEFELYNYEQPRPCGHCTEGCCFCNGTKQATRMVEISFAVKLFDYWESTNQGQVSTPIYYSGRIDLPTWQHGKLFITDHKTSSIMGQTVFDNLNMSDQQKGYCWAFEQATGRKVDGYMPNVIRSKEPPQYVMENREFRGKSQSPAKWWEESFQRDFHYLQPGELDEWKQNTIAKVEEFFWHYSRGYLPMEHTACTRFGRCPYFEVCNVYPVNERLSILNSNLFKDNNWTPLITKT